jgi:serine protease Do
MTPTDLPSTAVARLRLVFCLLSQSLLSLSVPAGEDPASRFDKANQAGVEVLVDRHLNGSGWLAAEPGYAFTAAHVVANKNSILAVRLSDGRLLPAHVQARDLLHDAALLHLDGDLGNLPAGLPFADKEPALGQPLWVFGAPLYRHGVFLPGTVAKAALTYEWMGDTGHAIKCRLVACTVPKGMSGGPWLDAEMRVVGVQSGGMTDHQVFCGISFVPPANALARLLQTKADQPTAWLGAAVEELDEQPAKEIKRFPTDAAGVVIKAVARDGPAAKAGLANGTLLIRCGGQVLTTRNAFYQFLAAQPPGGKLTLETLVPDQPKPVMITVQL